MRVIFLNHPLQHSLLSFFASTVFCFSLLVPQIANAEIITIPLQRVIATQPITSLEVIAIVKSLLNGRVLSIKKQSSYSNPDCHTVKFLEDEGEFQVIKVGCFTDKIAQTKS
jgi:hypothetical protein